MAHNNPTTVVNDSLSAGDGDRNEERKSKNFEKMKLLMELEKFGFQLGKRIGKGSFSKVYYAEYNRPSKKTVFGKTQQSFACKVIDQRITTTEFVGKFLPRELKIIQKISHPNIVSAYTILELGPYTCIFTDYCAGGDLLGRLRSIGPLSENRTNLYFGQIVSAVNYLHSNGIAHRDIKCENILLHSRNHVKLTDFGFARKLQYSFTDYRNKQNMFSQTYSQTYCGSESYASPEVLQNIPYDPVLLDMWSLGCVLYIMITGTMPFEEGCITKTIKEQISYQAIYRDNLSKINPYIYDIICKLLEPNPKKRWRMKSLLKHPWITTNCAAVAAPM